MVKKLKAIAALAAVCLLVSTQIASAKGGIHIPHIGPSHQQKEKIFVAAAPPPNPVSRAVVNVATAVASEDYQLCVGAVRGTAGSLVGLRCVPAAAAAFAECNLAAGGPEDPVALAVCPLASAAVKVVCGAAAGATFATSMADPLVERVCGDK